MATAGHFNKHAAYSKLLLHLMKCGTKVLRRLLKEHIKQYGQPIDSFLSARKHTLLKDIVGKMNRTILFPNNQQPTNIECWDICLLVHVLLTTCRNLPPHIIQSLKDLRIIRNELAHSEGATISKTQFIAFWGRTGTVIGNILGIINDSLFAKEIQTSVHGIENGLFLHDVAEYQRIIHQWCQLDNLAVEKLEEVKEGLYLKSKCMLVVSEVISLNIVVSLR